MVPIPGQWRAGIKLLRETRRCRRRNVDLTKQLNLMFGTTVDVGKNQLYWYGHVKRWYQAGMGNIFVIGS